MAASSQGPYIPFEKEDAADTIRLLSLAPGTYDDTIRITLTTHNITSIQEDLVVSRRFKHHLEHICTELLKVDRSTTDLKYHDILAQCQAYVNILNGILGDVEDGDKLSIEEAPSTKELLRDLEQLVTDPLYQDAQSTVSALASFILRYETPITDFEALSYSWGTAMSINLAVVNGYQMKITENLNVALRQLRHHDTSRIMWVDALCINQEDIDERNSQIQHMSCIYGGARQTIVWLGSTADGSDLLLDALVKGSIADTEAVAFGFYMEKLMTRSWWTRVWIIQEVVFSRKVIMHCGDRSVAFDLFTREQSRLYDRFMNEQAHLYDVAKFLIQTKRFLVTLDYTKPLLGVAFRAPFETLSEDLLNSVSKILVRCAWHESNTILLPLVILMNENSVLRKEFLLLQVFTARFEATDMRDKVYALLNICPRPGWRIVPDYAKSTATVFSEAMALAISESLETAYFYIPLHIGRDLVSELPSWVPNMAINFRPTDIGDFRALGLSHKQSFDAWEAFQPRNYHPDSTYLVDLLTELEQTGFKPQNTISFSDESRVLHTTGSLMGTVIEVFEICPDDMRDRYDEEEYKQPMTKLRNFFYKHQIPAQKALSALLSSTPGPYHADPTLSEAFENLLTLEASDDMPAPPGAHHVRAKIRDAVLGRNMYCTDTGHVGRSPEGLKVGDVLAGLFGFKLPFILRHTGDGTYTMVNVTHVADHVLGVSGGSQENFIII